MIPIWYYFSFTAHLIKTEFRPRLYLQDNSPFSQNIVQTQIIFVRQQSIYSKQSSDPDYICKTTVHFLKKEFRPRLYLQDNSPFTQNWVQTQIIFVNKNQIPVQSHFWIRPRLFFSLNYFSFFLYWSRVISFFKCLKPVTMATLKLAKFI